MATLHRRTAYTIDPQTQFATLSNEGNPDVPPNCVCLHEMLVCVASQQEIRPTHAERSRKKVVQSAPFHVTSKTRALTVDTCSTPRTIRFSFQKFAPNCYICSGCPVVFGWASSNSVDQGLCFISLLNGLRPSFSSSLVPDSAAGKCIIATIKVAHTAEIENELHLTPHIKPPAFIIFHPSPIYSS